MLCLSSNVVITGHKMSLCLWLVEPRMKKRLLFISWIKTTSGLGLFWVEQLFTIQAVSLKRFSKQCKVSQDVTCAQGIHELFIATSPQCMYINMTSVLKNDEFFGKYKYICIPVNYTHCQCRKPLLDKVIWPFEVYNKWHSTKSKLSSLNFETVTLSLTFHWNMIF